MSQQACAEFFAKIDTDAALQQEISTALDNKDNLTAATTFAEIGAKYGYKFTAEEAARTYQEMQITDTELDEAALDKVAGGFDLTKTIKIEHKDPVLPKYSWYPRGSDQNDSID